MRAGSIFRRGCSVGADDLDYAALLCALEDARMRRHERTGTRGVCERRSASTHRWRRAAGRPTVALLAFGDFDRSRCLLALARVGGTCDGGSGRGGIGIPRHRRPCSRCLLLLRRHRSAVARVGGTRRGRVGVRSTSRGTPRCERAVSVQPNQKFKSRRFGAVGNGAAGTRKRQEVLLSKGKRHSPVASHQRPHKYARKSRHAHKSNAGWRWP